MLFLLYALIGIGLRGGWQHWKDLGRGFYTLGFPLHSLMFLALAGLRRAAKVPSVVSTTGAIVAIVLLSLGACAITGDPAAGVCAFIFLALVAWGGTP